MTRVLVSGGTGTVGRFIVEDLLANGYKVTVGGRTPPAPGFFSKEVAYTPLRLDADIDQIDAFENIYYFVHAAFSHVPKKYRGGEGDDPQGFRSANLNGSVRLFEAARDAGVRRCVFLSSRAVYGPQPSVTLLNEDVLAKPDTLYGRVKLDTERSLQALCAHNFITASLRVTGVYGPAGPGRQHKWQDLFDDYLSGRPVAARAGTEVHGCDVAAAVRLMLETDAMRVNGEVFNVSDVLVDTRAILAPVQRKTGCRHPLPDAADLSTFSGMATDRIRMLGWQPGGMLKFRETLEALSP